MFALLAAGTTPIEPRFIIIVVYLSILQGHTAQAKSDKNQINTPEQLEPASPKLNEFKIPNQPLFTGVLFYPLGTYPKQYTEHMVALMNKAFLPTAPLQFTTAKPSAGSYLWSPDSHNLLFSQPIFYPKHKGGLRKRSFNKKV